MPMPVVVEKHFKETTKDKISVGFSGSYEMDIDLQDDEPSVEYEPWQQISLVQKALIEKSGVLDQFIVKKELDNSTLKSSEVQNSSAIIDESCEHVVRHQL